MRLEEQKQYCARFGIILLVGWTVDIADKYGGLCVRFQFFLGMTVVALAFQGCSGARMVPDNKPGVSVVPPLPEKAVTEYTHASSGIRMKAPDGWTFVDKPQYVEAECRPVRTKEDLPVILVQTASFSTQLSMKAIVSGFALKIARGVDSPKLSKDQVIPIKIEDAEAYEISYTGKLAGQAIQGSQVLIRRGRWFFVITRMCKEKDYPKLRTQLDAFINNLSEK